MQCSMPGSENPSAALVPRCAQKDSVFAASALRCSVVGQALRPAKVGTLFSAAGGAFTLPRRCLYPPEKRCRTTVPVAADRRMIKFGHHPYVPTVEMSKQLVGPTLGITVWKQMVTSAATKVAGMCPLRLDGSDLGTESRSPSRVENKMLSWVPVAPKRALLVYAVGLLAALMSQAMPSWAKKKLNLPVTLGQMRLLCAPTSLGL